MAKKVFDESGQLAFSIAEVAHMLRIDDNTVYREIEEKKLPAKKLRTRTVILKADLDRYLADLPPFTGAV